MEIVVFRFILTADEYQDGSLHARTHTQGVDFTCDNFIRSPQAESSFNLAQ